MEETNLLELITKDKETISSYLGDVATEQFIEDVKNLLKINTDKQVIEQAIKKLQALI
jgi:hypothetical protein